MADVEPAAQIEEPKEVPKDEVENENPAPEESVPEKVDEDNKDANMESEKKKKKKKKSKKKTVGVGTPWRRNRVGSILPEARNLGGFVDWYVKSGQTIDLQTPVRFPSRV